VSSSPCYPDAIVIPLIVGETVLDVACGCRRHGRVRKEYRSVRIDESIPAGVASGAALAAQRHVGCGPGM
jgi:hypothetical protein